MEMIFRCLSLTTKTIIRFDSVANKVSGRDQVNVVLWTKNGWKNKSLWIKGEENSIELMTKKERGNY